jgi:uncharacterized protein YecT (DUF1311 family)
MVETIIGVVLAWGMAYLVVILLIYFLPAIIAMSRGHKNALAIVLLNILVGWTGIGWIVILVWSLSSFVLSHDRQTPATVINVHNQALNPRDSHLVPRNDLRDSGSPVWVAGAGENAGSGIGDANSAAARNPTRACPYCAEVILAKAKLCKHCRCEVTPVAMPEVPVSASKPLLAVGDRPLVSGIRAPPLATKSNGLAIGVGLLLVIVAGVFVVRDPGRWRSMVGLAVSEESGETGERIGAPSFNCANASIQAERLVCSDSELARLDVDLADAYSNARSQLVDKGALQKAQNKWRKNVRDRCSDIACLKKAYTERIAQLPEPQLRLR